MKSNHHLHLMYLFSDYRAAGFLLAELTKQSASSSAFARGDIKACAHVKSVESGWIQRLTIF
jgi:hypothetical protein